MSWSDDYVGLPYADLGRDRSGADCYGLACIVYEERLGISLASYAGAYASAAEQAEVAALLEAAESRLPWRRVGDVAPFDLLLFRRGRLRSHVGIAVDARRMLHMEERSHACIARLDEPRWSARFLGGFRHVEARLKAS